MQKGIFITVEGVDGAGKSTHLPWMIDCFQRNTRDFVLTREPGGTSLGEKLREIVLHEPMDLETEALLMFAARREHIVQVILPALSQGKIVISDRFTDATYAYQGGGRGLDWHKIATLETWVQHDLQPDLTLLFDVPLEIAQERLSRGRGILDKFEQEPWDFFVRTRDTYLKRASENPQRFAIIDSSGSIEETRYQVCITLNERLMMNLIP